MVAHFVLVVFETFSLSYWGFQYRLFVDLSSAGTAFMTVVSTAVLALEQSRLALIGFQGSAKECHISIKAS